MEMRSLDITKKIEMIWPQSFHFLQRMYSDYSIPIKKEIEDFINSVYIEEYQYTAEMMDCEDFALILHAFVIQQRYKEMQQHGWDESQRLPWAFGQIWLESHQGIRSNHAQNICLASESESSIEDINIFLIEPQNNQFFQATAGDVPIFVMI